MALTDLTYRATKRLNKLPGSPYVPGDEFPGSEFGSDTLARKYIANGLVDVTDGAGSGAPPEVGDFFAFFEQLILRPWDNPDLEPTASRGESVYYDTSPEWDNIWGNPDIAVTEAGLYAIHVAGRVDSANTEWGDAVRTDVYLMDAEGNELTDESAGITPLASIPVPPDNARTVSVHESFVVRLPAGAHIELAVRTDGAGPFGQKVVSGRVERIA